jgi:hypothetical protein
MRGVRWVGDDSRFVFRQKPLGEDGSVRRGVVMVKQPSLFSPKFGATFWHVFTQSLQTFAVERGIHSLACWDRCFALPQLLNRWRHHSGIFWISPRIVYTCCGVSGNVINQCRGRNSSVGAATVCGLDGPGIESRWGRDFSHTSRAGVKRPKRGADHPPPSSVEVKKE